MIDAERMVWCAAFGAAFACPDRLWFEDGDMLVVGARGDVAKEHARRAVEALGGPSAGLSADSMMIAAIAEHGLTRAVKEA